MASSVARLAVRNNSARIYLVLSSSSCLSFVPRSSFHASSRLLQSTVAPQKDKIAILPPNLTFDKRSTCSPFYGLEQIERDEEDKDEEESVVEDDDSLKESWYDASAKNDDIVYAVPLPDRLHVPVLDMKDATETGTLWLNEAVFGMDPVRVDLIQRAVLYYRNKARGRRKAITKTISEVSGSGRKVRPQKGQGAARAGHSRPAHWRGGAKAHGPKGSIQNYANTKLNKKVRRLALLNALSQKLKEGNLILVNHLNLESHKTKHLAKLLENFEIAGRYGTTAYMLDHVHQEEDEDTDVVTSGNVPVHLLVASKNLYKIKVANQLMANVYDILKHEKLVITLGAITAMEERLTRPPK